MQFNQIIIKIQPHVDLRGTIKLE